MSDCYNDDECNICGCYNNKYVVCDECIEDLINKKIAERTIKPPSFEPIRAAFNHFGCIDFRFADNGIVTAEAMDSDGKVFFLDKFETFNLAFDTVKNYVNGRISA